VNHPQIAAFARLAKENTLPTRSIAGQKTQTTRTMHYMQYDPVHDELVVGSSFNRAVLTFAGNANGEVAPIRVIRGPKTQIVGNDYDGNDKATVDGVNGEIYVPTSTNTSPYSTILVFDRLANGDVPPKRILGGPDTQIRGSARGHAAVAIDAVNDLLVVKSPGDGSILIFERTASGNAKPLRVIRGPNSQATGTLNSLQVYSPQNLVISACANGAICAWSIHANGDVPPLFRIPVREITGIELSGVALDPVHKEIFVSSGAGNVVMTFYWPEIFG
jgi:hypothetical protein